MLAGDYFRDNWEHKNFESKERKETQKEDDS